jgi:hypothetical protein
MGSSSLNAEVNAFDNLHIVRASNRGRYAANCRRIGSNLRRIAVNASREAVFQREVLGVFREDPEFPAGIELTEGDGRGSYNGLSVKLNQRFKWGLTSLISYTWSKALDDGSAIRGNAVIGVANGDMYPQNPLCRRCEKGQSAFNTPARLVTSLLYELPLGKGKPLLNRGGFLNQVVGGWQTGAIVTA